jgi:D-lactate dehydrogenase (cytochrome)
VPLSHLAECIARVQKDLSTSSLLAPLVGHIGDGNFHLQYLIDPEAPEEVAEAQRLHEALVQHALSLGGTCTGEHGVGLGKAKYLRAEFGAAYGLLEQLKMAIDPQNIMNPGKVVAL